MSSTWVRPCMCASLLRTQLSHHNLTCCASASPLFFFNFLASFACRLAVCQRLIPCRKAVREPWSRLDTRVFLLFKIPRCVHVCLCESVRVSECVSVCLCVCACLPQPKPNQLMSHLLSTVFFFNCLLLLLLLLLLQLSSSSSSASSLLAQPTTVGTTDENQMLNRYRNIIPYDATRVTVTPNQVRTTRILRLLLFLPQQECFVAFVLLRFASPLLPFFALVCARKMRCLSLQTAVQRQQRLHQRVLCDRFCAKAIHRLARPCSRRLQCFLADGLGAKR